METFRDQVFEQQDYQNNSLVEHDYDGCSFINCSFKDTDLSETIFSECEFVGCDLSQAKILNTSFKEVSFKDCKLLGLQFDMCNPFLFEVSFDHCTLDLSSFHNWKMKQTTFSHCLLKEVDFSNSDLHFAKFIDCDLTGAIFDHSKLVGADLSSSFGFIIDPEKNKIQQAKFSAHGLAGLLSKYGIKIVDH